VFFGRGNGKLGKPTTYSVSAPYDIAAGDLNGDQFPDLAISDGLHGLVAVLLNKGNGQFRKPRGYGAGQGEVHDVAIADLNHDGFADLVAANASLSAVALLFNNGDGTFGDATLYPTSLPNESTGAQAVVVADFNRDGIPDIAAVNQLNNSALFYGKGNGKFKPAIPIKNGVDFQGDFNNDQAPDLAIPIFNKGEVAIMLNKH
jgi:FG-GAP-like repeat